MNTGIQRRFQLFQNNSTLYLVVVCCNGIEETSNFLATASCSATPNWIVEPIGNEGCWCSWLPVITKWELETKVMEATGLTWKRENKRLANLDYWLVGWRLSRCWLAQFKVSHFDVLFRLNVMIEMFQSGDDVIFNQSDVVFNDL